MTGRHVKRIRRLARFLPGLVLTLLAVALQLTGLGQRAGIEPLLHDLFFWNVRPAEEVSPEITVIEIDDLALETFGRWPWPWRDVGDIVSSLADLQARVVALDITYGHQPDPIFPEGVSAGQSAVAEDQVQPLARALSLPRRSVMTYPVSTSARTLDRRRTMENGLAALCDEGRGLDAARLQLAQQLDSNAGNASAGDAEMQAVLLRMAADWACRRNALMELGTIPCDGAVPGGVQRIDRPDPPLAALLRSATGSGYANAQGDADGTIRRISLVMATSGNRLLPQFALEIAMQGLGWDDYRVQWTGPRALRLSSADGGNSIDVPLDEGGNMVINWSGTGSAGRIRRLSVQKLREHGLLTAYGRVYDQCMSRLGHHWSDLGRQRDILLLRRQIIWPNAPLMDFALQQQLLAVEEQLAMEAITLDGMPRPPHLSEAEYERLSQDAAFIKEHDKHGERNQQRLRRLEAELEPFIRDRICIIGMTATSLSPDLKPTPIHPMLPGVYAHAHIVDNLLRKSFVREPSRWQAAAVTGIVGILATLLAGGLAPLRSVLGALAMLVVYYGLSLGTFHRFGLLMPLAWPWTAGLSAVIGVVTWRELTEGRQRRWITNVFKQYTSDQLVDALVENPADLVLGGQRRDMTVYFSDIAGFTGISERLDPPTLVAFLQTYLETATDRLLEQGGTLDKYQGDGIVAFFGAPLPMPDNAARCLRAAKAHLRALPLLNDHLRRQGLLPDNFDLSVRIGLSTGSMIVGNIGSSRRFEYTVIGDAVNVGARIEGANRFFGTTDRKSVV